MSSLVLDPRLSDAPPFGLAPEVKSALLLARLNELTTHHYRNCGPYRRIVDGAFGGLREAATLAEVPFLPVQIFKRHELSSVPPEAVAKVLTSSGTTGQAPSRIYLDGPTAQLQARVLVKIVQHFAGVERRPMVLVDTQATIKNRQSYSARGAGLLGMMQFGRNPFWLLREDMTPDWDGLDAYLARFPGETILFFGFTFIVWQHLVTVAEKEGRRWSLSENSLLFHSGGWKKLADQAVSKQEFGARVRGVLGAGRVVNFYGMVEQVGSVFFENPEGWLQTPSTADVLIRDPHTLAPVAEGETGIVQVFSALPGSYPGHSLLTEDRGVIRQADGQLRGRSFEVLGRLPQTEMRGCSDTYQQQPAGARA